MNTEAVKSKTRFHLIDQIRGLAIVLMAIFHFSFDLKAFGYAQIDFHNDQFWFIFPRVIVFLFMFAVGLSLPLVHLPKIQWKTFWKRFAQLAIFALIISVSTYYLFPTTWIYFGTLHSIALCSLLALPFLKHPKLGALLAIILICLALFWGISIPWIQLKHKSMDYIPPFPWLGVVLLGIYFTSLGFHKKSLGSNPFLKFLALLGRHSLWIYLAHQPLLYGLVFVYWKFTQ